MARKKDPRDDTVFIKESRRLRNGMAEHFFTIIAIYAALYAFIAVPLFMAKDVLDRDDVIALLMLAALILIPILRSVWLMFEWYKKHREFKELIYSLDEEVIAEWNRQALESGCLLDAFYLLEDCLYVSGADAIIPYEDIREMFFYRYAPSRTPRIKPRPIFGIKLNDDTVYDLYKIKVTESQVAEFRAMLRINTDKVKEKRGNAADNGGAEK